MKQQKTLLHIWTENQRDHWGYTEHWSARPFVPNNTTVLDRLKWHRQSLLQTSLTIPESRSVVGTPLLGKPWCYEHAVQHRGTALPHPVFYKLRTLSFQNSTALKACFEGQWSAEPRRHRSELQDVSMEGSPPSPRRTPQKATPVPGRWVTQQI